MDVLVGLYSRDGEGRPLGQLLLNDGGGSLTKVDSALDVESGGPVNAIATADLNGENNPMTIRK
jgi:hypothetical protein